MDENEFIEKHESHQGGVAEDERLRRRSSRSFILYSTIAILVTGVAIGWFVIRGVQLEMVEAYGLATLSQVNGAVNSFISPADLRTAPNGAEYRALNRDVEKIITGTGIKEVKIWRTDGTVIYSRDRGEVGKKYPVSDEMAGALRGRPVFDFSELDEEHNERERKEHGRLLDMYYPLRLKGGKPVDGVFEVYVSIAPVVRHTREVLGYVAGGLGLLTLFLVVFAQVSSRLLRARNNDLSAMADELSDKAFALERSRERWRAIADTAVDAIVSINSQGRIIFWNPAAEKIFGYSVEEAVGGEVTMIIPERLRAAHLRGMARRAAGGPPRHVGRTMELVALRKNGQEFPMALSLAEMRTHEERVFVGIIRDITERTEMDDALRESERRYRTLVENASESISKLDLDGKFTFMSPAGLRICGFNDVGEIVGRKGTELVEPQYRDEALRALDRARSGAVAHFEYQSRTVDGLRWFESVISPEVDSHGTIRGFVGMASDVTDRKAVEDLLRFQSTHDSLTGLENRGAFFNSLDREIEHARRYDRPFSLVMLDLDHFKNINDTFGHPAGDTVLRAVAKSIAETSRAADIVCRYGGEEFTVIMPETNLLFARRGAERIREAVAAGDILLDGGRRVRVTISCGVVSFPEEANNGKDLVDKADANLYRAKETGRNRVWPAARAA